MKFLIYPSLTHELHKKNSIIKNSFDLMRIKNVKTIDNETRSVKLYELFKYSDKWDRLMIFAGVLASLAAACCHVSAFYLWGQMGSILIGYQKLKYLIAMNYHHKNPQDETIPDDLNQTIINMSSSSGENIKKCLEYFIVNEDFESRLSNVKTLFLVVALMFLFCNLMTSILFNKSAERQIKRIREKLYEKIIRKEIQFLDQNTPSELNNLVLKNTDALFNVINFRFGEFVGNLAKIIGCIAFAFASSWQSAIVYLPFFIVLLIVSPVIFKKIQANANKEKCAYESANKFVQQTLDSIRTVASFGLEKVFISKYAKLLEVTKKLSLKNGLISGTVEEISVDICALLHAFSIAYLTSLAEKRCEHQSYVDLTRSFFSILFACLNIISLILFLKQILDTEKSQRKVFEILDDRINELDHRSSSNNNAISDSDMFGTIKFENVYFKYPNRPNINILKGLNLEIRFGSTVAFVGASGGGKSTVISLLERFYLPSSGRITFSNRDISDFDLNWLRNQISCVSQEHMLFPTTIKENIRFGRLNATDEEIEQAATLVYAHEFISRLPKKYETEIGERGVQLSDCQKQRIALARALIRNPKILLLDEPTGNMDYKSEEIVQSAINKAKMGRTTIIVTNKLRTIRNVDKIFLLENGQVKESGTHDELMELKGRYQKIFYAQEKRNLSKVNESNNGVLDGVQPKKMLNEQKSETKEENKKEYFRYELKLLKLIKGEIFSLLFGTITQTLSGAIYPATAYMFSFIFYILPLMNLKEQLAQSLQFMEIILALALIYFLSIFVKNYSFAHSSSILAYKIRKKMFKSMLRQDISYHDKEQKRLAHLNSQIGVITKYCNSLTTDRISLLSHGFGGILFCLIVAFLSSWKLALILIAFIPFNLFCAIVANFVQNKCKKRANRSNEKLGNFMLASFKNIQTLVAFDLEQYFINQFKEKINDKKNSALMLLNIHGLFQSLMSSLLFFITIVTLSFCYSIIEADNILVHRIYQVYIPIALCSVLVARVYNQLPYLKKARSSTKSAFEIIERKSKIDPLSKEQELKLARCNGSIEFKNVCFSYPNKPNKKVLDNFNLKINSNQINALVGPYGSGKSTVVSLLLRFYDVDSGQITLDNVDIKDLNVSWLRSIIGIVSKDTVLFDMSIKENIALGDASLFNKFQIDEISNLAYRVDIRSKIENLPEKYDTIVGSEGLQLSSIDKQRIAIARVLMRNPKILILDEATSALDSHSKQVVQDVLSGIQTGRTSIVIAHRIRSIKNAHTTAVIKNGQVIKDGYHSIISTESSKNDIKFYKRRTRLDTINLSFNLDPIT